MHPYEVYAIRYAHHERTANQNFLGGDADDSPMPMDYFLWAIKGPNAVYIVDTGFDQEMAKKRGREFLLAPENALQMIGISHEKVRDVIVTHLHHDHAGNHHLFPNAAFHLQDREMAYATGRSMCHCCMRLPYEEGDVVQMVRRVFAGHVCFHDGAHELAPGISIHHMGGHTDGIQCVRVYTQRGYLVLASDVAHYYANMKQGRPFPFLSNVLDSLEAYARLRELASSEDLVIPGHDPLVLRRYPPAVPGVEGIVRLDVEPLRST